MKAHPSRAILAERIAALPATLAEAAATALPGDGASWAAFCASERFVVTGGGLSEGPARVLCALLRHAGRDARFVAQSDLAGRPAPRADLDGAALVLFSQGLAPNARLPLPWLGPGLVGPDGEVVMACGLLVTSVKPGAPSSPAVDGIARRLGDAGHLVWVLPPAREDKLLLRVLGPAVAVLAALRIAEAIAPGRVLPTVFAPAGLAMLAERALARPAVDLFGSGRRPVVIVAEPALVELAMPLRWKLLEGLRVPDPPVWDPLQVAHGPLQSLFDERATILALRTPSGDHDDLFARLRGVLRTDGADAPHRWVELRTEQPGPLGLVELDALLDAALLATLAAHPLPLDDWPSRGQDGALYEVDPQLLRGTRP